MTDTIFFLNGGDCLWLAESCLYGQELCKTGSSPSVNYEFLQEISNRQKEVLMNCSMNRFISSSVTCCLLLEECVDMRKELCYLSFTDGQCSQPMTNEQTRMLCCCSMGQAWGHPCQPCPADKTSESSASVYHLFYHHTGSGSETGRFIKTFKMSVITI